MRSCSGIYRLGCLLHEEGIFLRGDGITSGIQRRGVLSTGHPLGPRGLTITMFPSSTILVSVSSSSSSCSWKITSSWWASSSSCILQSLRIFSYFVMAHSIAVRAVCKEFSRCSSSLPDALSVTICMASDVASNSAHRSVLRLLQFPRDIAALPRFVSTCLRFSLRTWVTTSSKRSSQAVPGLRK